MKAVEKIDEILKEDISNFHNLKVGFEKILSNLFYYHLNIAKKAFQNNVFEIAAAILGFAYALQFCHVYVRFVFCKLEVGTERTSKRKE